ncbi:MAG: M48 family metallopeptidase [Chitinophagales bacterium]
MKQYVCLLLLLFGITSLTAQNFDVDYEPLKVKGQIPKEILTASSQKYKANKESIGREDKLRTRKDKEKFYLQSNFVIDEMMRSGRVLFNDELSGYVNKVADKLLAHNVDLRQELNFYTIKSPIVNAFATDRGSIFISVGLLARLEDEAQLAYILAHEIVHYQEKHNIQTYVEYAEIELDKDYTRSKSYEKLLEKNNYSKELEHEADDAGLEIFLKSGYNFESIPNVFDILGLAHVPYTNLTFNPQFLHTPNIQFSADYSLDSVNIIKPYEVDSDESTHPSTEERKSKLLDKLINKPDNNKPKFLVSETEFNRIKKTAQFELCNLFLKYQGYIWAIYHTYALLQEHPNNQFLIKILGKSLYGLAQYKNANRYNEIMPHDYKDFQGEIQKVYYLFEKMHSKELNVLAAVHTWELHQKFPESKELELMARDMIEDLAIYPIEKPFEFFQKERGSSKLAKADSSFARYGLGDLIENETIIEWLENGKKYRKKFNKEDKYYETSKGKETFRKERKEERKKGKSLGIDKIVFINPTYIHINARKETPYRYIESEQTQKKLNGWIKQVGKKLDLETNILDLRNLSKSKDNINIYQDITILTEWVDEHLSHNMFMINSNYDEILALADKYGSDYFSYAGVLSYKRKKRPNTRSILTYRTKYECLHFNLVFDIRQNKKILTETNLTRYQDNDIIIRQNIYWAMLQMKRKAKEK